MSEGEEVTIETAALRRILHRYNNLTSRILTRAEVALLEDDTDEFRAALDAICTSALELGEFTKEVRAEFLRGD